jgi:hypothetical protein
MSVMTPLAALRPTDPAPTIAPVPDAAPAPAAAPQGEVVPIETASLPNPSSHLDAALGLVVLVFRDANGQTRSIPSERELEAYRSSPQSGAEPSLVRDIETGA